jgi:hypothetical protein
MACVPGVPIKQRVAVGRAARNLGCADVAAGASAVVDHERLSERRRQLRGQDAGDDIGRSARRDRSGRYRPVELAGRFMGGTAGLHLLGVPVATLVLRQFIARFDLDASIAPKLDALAVRQVCTYVVRRDEEDVLHSTGVWQAADPRPPG